jgi:hypothetical protein
MLLFVNCCRRKRAPAGQDTTDARWLLRTYWIVSIMVFSIVLFLILAALLLEYGRERQISFTAGISRQVTAIPLIVAVFLLLCAVLESICLYPTVRSLLRQSGSSRSGAGGDETTEMSDVPFDELGEGEEPQDQESESSRSESDDGAEPQPIPTSVEHRTAHSTTVSDSANAIPNV